MNTMKAIKEFIETAKASEDIRAALSNPEDPKEVLLAALDRSIALLNETISKDYIAPGDDDAILARATAAASMHNDYVVLERLGELGKLDPADAMKSYLENQSAGGYTVSLNQKSGLYERRDRDVLVDFYDFMRVCRPTEVAGLTDAICIFVDNLARFDCCQEEAFVSRKALTSNYAALRKRMGWDTFKSKTELLRQFNELVNKFIMPTGMEEKMLKCDMRFVKTAAVIAKDAINAPGKYQQRTEEKLYAFIFRAIYTRHNGLAYEWQDGRGATKNPDGYKANGEMAEKAKPAKEATPDASHVVVSKTAKAAK